MKNVIASILFLAFLSCDGKTDNFYFTSFESPGQLSGWQQVDSSMLVNDPSPNGGAKSLNVGAGCYGPRPYVTLILPEGDYRLRFWAKNSQGSLGGGVSLQNTGTNESISIDVQDYNWIFYESGRTIRSRILQRFELHVDAGGIAYGNITVDQISIEKVN